MSFYTAGCVNKIAVSVTGPRAVKELGGSVIPGNVHMLFKLKRKIRIRAFTESVTFVRIGNIFPIFSHFKLVFSYVVNILWGCFQNSCVDRSHASP